MKFHTASLALALTVSSAAVAVQAVPALDDPNTAVTVMQFAGASRLKSFRDWEAMLLKPEFQKLVAAAREAGDVTPKTFSPVKRRKRPLPDTTSHWWCCTGCSRFC